MLWYQWAFWVLSSFLFMEFMAWFTHKYIMHGFLWVLHRDHHIRDGRRFEWNDLFALMFALPSIYLIYLGAAQGSDLRLAIGIGIALYGLAYFLFHDVYVHRRVKFGKLPENRYLRATLKAHLDHHKPHSQRNFGFLLAPLKYYQAEWSNKQ
ncbi:MAG: sterol desaturase family protein [Bacteroidales bacterium]